VTAAGTRTFNFTTGPTTIPDVGQLAYNGCIFGPLFETNISGKIVKDDAGRTTKYMEYTLTADGYVTLPSGARSIDPPMRTLRRLLTAQGGALTYNGRGFDLVVNNSNGGTGANVGAKPGGSISSIPTFTSLPEDVAWGPVPELLEFQPLGGGLSAKIRWQVVVRIPEIAKSVFGILQLNYETSVSYNEDYFSTLSIRGTLEVPATRQQSQGDRTLGYTVDNYRKLLERRILTGIDLSRFRVTRREFSVSRDKRTLEWEVMAEEKPYMDLPLGCAIARGTYSVRPQKVGMGLVTWLCTLRATYTAAGGAPRRLAWYGFLALLRERMAASSLGQLPEVAKPQAPVIPVGAGPLIGAAIYGAPGAVVGFGIDIYRAIFSKPTKSESSVPNPDRPAWLLDFQIDEGLYLDSKTVSFSATWRLVTKFASILLGSGIWRKVPDKDQLGNNLWATTMRDVSGVFSWLPNVLDPKLDVIVDFGGPADGV
jgi:hypothetical protein